MPQPVSRKYRTMRMREYSMACLSFSGGSEYAGFAVEGCWVCAEVSAGAVVWAGRECVAKTATSVSSKTRRRSMDRALLKQCSQCARLLTGAQSILLVSRLALLYVDSH